MCKFPRKKRRRKEIIIIIISFSLFFFLKKFGDKYVLFFMGRIYRYDVPSRWKLFFK